MKLATLALFGLLLSACTTTSEYSEQYSDLAREAQKNDLQGFKEAYAKANLRVWQKRDLIFESLLETKEGKPCKEEIGLFLISQGAIENQEPDFFERNQSLVRKVQGGKDNKRRALGPRDLLAESSSRGCVAMTELVAKKSQSSELAWASKAYLKNFRKRVFYPEVQKNHTDIFKILFEENKKNCDMSNAKSEPCSANESFVAEVEFLKKEAAKEAYAESPEAKMREICQLQEQLEREKRVIDRENEIGKHSGFVNSRRMYEAGQVIQYNSKKIEFLLGEVSKQTGQKVSRFNCI